jgi:hypothetical protein
MAGSLVGQSIAYPLPKDERATLRQDLDKSGALYGRELGNRKSSNPTSQRSASCFEAAQSAEQISARENS